MAPRSGSGTMLDPTMSLVGRLEDLSLGEILQIVSLSKRSGLLRLEGPEGKTNIFIKAGKVLYAARSDEREGVIGLLVHHGLVDLAKLEPLRAELEAINTAGRLGVFLRDRLGIAPDAFQKALRKRIEEMVFSLFLWEEGTFSFQLVEDESSHPVLAPVMPLFLEEGIGAQFLVMEGARRKDEMKRAATAEPQPFSAPVPPSQEMEAGWEQPAPSTIAQDRLAAEVEAFAVPMIMPPLPAKVARVVLLVSAGDRIRDVLSKALETNGIKVLAVHEVAEAISRIQELRAHNIFPFLAVDLESGGITDDLQMGGLDLISTLWDLGFNLPLALLYHREISSILRSKLEPISSVTLIRDEGICGQPAPGAVARLAEAVMGVIDRQHEAAAEPGEGEEFFDIQQELHEDLAGLDLPFDGWQDAVESEHSRTSDPKMARLSSYVSELNRQDISGEITLLALRYASEFTSRAILFLVRKTDLKGLGQFGVDLGEDHDADGVIRSLELPIEKGSPFARVVEIQASYRGRPRGSRTEALLYESLGGGIPSEIYIGPVISMGKVAVLLYGDDYPALKGLETTQTLDVFLSHAGLALDRAYLEMKLKARV